LDLKASVSRSFVSFILFFILSIRSRSSASRRLNLWISVLLNRLFSIVLSFFTNPLAQAGVSIADIDNASNAPFLDWTVFFL
jgi:hypothetical protein